MADEPKPDPKDPPKPAPKDDDDPDELGAGGKAAIKRERDARKVAEQALADAAAKIKQFEDQGKTESDKLTERATTAERERDAAKAENARLTVALSKGLNASQAKRLVGSTKEELEADADEILESFGGAASSGGTRPPTTRPNPALRGGSDPTAEPEEMDPRKLAAQIPRT